ncbi:MAG: IclR family transcriptional regulator [Chloroflexota bacterium]
MSTTRSVDRAFSIMKVVSEYPEGIGITEISTKVGIAKSTVSRLVSTLQVWEMVTRTADNKIRLGPEPVRWVERQPFTMSLRQRFRPILQRLADQTGEAAALCIRDGYQVHYLDQVQGHHDIQVRDWTGERIPLHVLAAGKVLLAFGDAIFLERYLTRPLHHFTGHSITDRKQLKDMLNNVYTQGYALANEEYVEGIVGLATPIFDRQQNIIAALNIFGPKFRLDSPKKQKQIITEMQSIGLE